MWVIDRTSYLHSAAARRVINSHKAVMTSAFAARMLSVTDALAGFVPGLGNIITLRDLIAVITRLAKHPESPRTR